MFLYHSTNYLLVLAMLVSSYTPNSPKIIVAAGTVAIGITTFSNILLTRYFLNCCNCSSNYITRCGI